MSNEQLKVYLLDLLKAIPVTLEFTCIPMLAGAVLGLLVAVTRIQKVKVLSPIFTALVSAIRGIPIYVLVFVTYYGTPRLGNFLFHGGENVLTIRSVPNVVVAMGAFTLYTTAYISEIYRSAISSIDAGQMSAALAGGMNLFQAYRRVILPQALVVALPNYGNFFIATLKASSIVFVVSIRELMSVAKINTEMTHTYIQSYFIVAVFYVVLGLLFAYLFKQLEKRICHQY